VEYNHKSLEIHLKVFGNMHSKVADSYYSLGSALMQKKNYQESLNMYTKAKEVYLHLYGADHKDTKWAENGIHIVQQKLSCSIQ
jgi:hypothetical protein